MANDDVLGQSVFIRGKSGSNNIRNLVVNEDGSLLVGTSTSTSDIVSISSIAAGVVVGLSTLVNTVSLSTVAGANVVGLSTSLSNPVTPSIPLSTAATPTTVAGSTVTAQLLVANAARKGVYIASESTSTGRALIAFSSASTLTTWCVPLDPGGFYEMPLPVFTGALSVIHRAGVSTLLIEELT